MKKVLSYSLDHPDLVTTALQNVKLAKTIFPDWICRFYTSANIETSKFSAFDNVEIVENKEDILSPSVWRFEVADDNSVDAFLIRDMNDPFTEELYESLESWVSSKEVFFVSKSPEDIIPIMPGKWGMKSDGKTKMKQTLLRFFSRSEKINYDNLDLAFMWYYVIPLSVRNTYTHIEEL